MKIYKMFSILCLILSCISTLHSQPKINWTKIYYGNSLELNVARLMVKDKLGNFIVTGTSVVSYPNFSNYAVVTIKYDSLGNQKWIKIEDNPNNAMDDPTGLLVDDSNNVYVAGILGSYSFLLKYDENGNEKWIDYISSVYPDPTIINKHICLDKSGNIYYAIPAVINGNWHSTVRKYSSQGGLIWVKQFTSLSKTNDRPVSIIYDGDSFFYLTGYTVVTDTNQNYYIAKFDTNGSVIWEKNYGTDSTSYNIPRKLILDGNSDLYLMGRRNIISITDFLLDVIKLDSSGNKIWEKIITDTGYDIYENYNDIAIDNTHNVYITTSILPPNNPDKFYLVKLDSSGNLLWNNLSADSLSYNGCGYNINIDDQNNVYATGATTEYGIISYDLKVLKFDSLGNQIWSISKNFNNGTDRPVTTILNSDDDFTIFLTIHGTSNGSDYATVRYSNPVMNVKSSERIKHFELQQNYPNPFNPVTTIRYFIPRAVFVKLQVFDILGNKIRTLINKKQNHGNYKVEFDGSGLSSGIYFYKIAAGNFSQVKKMILLK